MCVRMHACMHVCGHTCGGALTGVCVWAYGSLRLVLGIIFNPFSTLYTEVGSLKQNPRLHQTSEAGITGIRVFSVHLNSTHHACKASALTLEPCPQL